MADETKTNTTPEAPDGHPAPEQTEQAVIPGMDGSPAPSGKVIDLSDMRAEAGKTGPESPAPGRFPQSRVLLAPLPSAPSRNGSGPRKNLKSPAVAACPRLTGPRRRLGKRKRPRAALPRPRPAGPPRPPGKGKRAAPGKGAPPTPAKEEDPAPPPEPAQPRDATRAVKEEVVYLNLSSLHPFKDHPFSVRDDAEMQGLVEAVRSGGVDQPALVRPRKCGSYEAIAGHRRQRASALAGFGNMPCIIRKMTDDQAVLAMTDDNLTVKCSCPAKRRRPCKQQ